MSQAGAIPARIGKYPIKRVLGEGAMGVVYEAIDPVIQRPLAVKTIRRQLIDGGQVGVMAVERFKNEAKAAGRLAHPAIAGVYEYGEDDAVAYIAMEFVAGNSLRDYMARKVPFAEADILSVMVQLLDALDYAHQHGVWHRDIKPANVMITRGGGVKITDFGIARIEAAGLTLDGSMLGTPGFMAPEQFSGEDIDHRVDIFAAGALFYQFLVGTPPFSGTLEAVMFKTVTEDVALPSTLPGGAQWAHFDAVIQGALARKREARFASAKDFRAALVAASAAPVVPNVAEATVILGAAEIERARQLAQKSLAAASRGVSTESGAATVFDAASLSLIEASLARHLGPLARLLVKQAAARASDLATLRQMLAEHIDQAEGRTAFLALGGGSEIRAAQAGGKAPAAAQAQPSAEATGTTNAKAGHQLGAAPSVPLTPALLERAVQLLSRELGPIARVVVKKAAAQAQDSEGLIAAILALVDAGSVNAEALRRELRS